MEMYFVLEANVREKWGFAHTLKENSENCCERLQFKKGCHVLNNPFMEQKPTMTSSGGVGTYCFVKETSSDSENEKPCFNQFSPPTTINCMRRRALKSFHSTQNCVKLPLNDEMSNYFFQSHFEIIQSSIKQHDFCSLHRQYPVDSCFWSRFFNSDRGRSRLRDGNQIPIKSLCCIEPAISSRRDESFRKIYCKFQ